jgi:hypothetical protein
MCPVLIFAVDIIEQTSQLDFYSQFSSHHTCTKEAPHSTRKVSLSHKILTSLVIISLTYHNLY